MMSRLLLSLFACVAIAACDKRELPPDVPDPGPPSTGETRITGSERIGWNQQAADTAELGGLQFVVYVDSTRTALADVRCGNTSGPAGFECSARLPSLTPGSHTLELAAAVVDPQGTTESGRSSPLRVLMAGGGGSSLSTSRSVTTSEGANLTLERIAEGLQLPSDIAFSEDAIFVAERGGTVRTIRQGALLPGAALDLSDEVTLPQGGLLAMTLDPKFDETGLVYALYAVGAPRRGLEFMLARFRAVRDVFGERAILLDRVPASPSGASGAVRIGPDGKLYVALDSAADAWTAGSLASYNGKVLRLNVDATTPDDQPGSTPVYSLDHDQPKALDWQPGSGRLWVVDGVDPSAGLLSAIAADDPQLQRAALRTAYALPDGTGASSAAFYRGDLMSMFRGNLFIAAEAGRQLMRLQFDPDNLTRVMSVERMLTDEIGPVRVVAEGPDGALYLASDTSLYRLHP